MSCVSEQIQKILNDKSRNTVEMGTALVWGVFLGIPTPFFSTAKSPW